MSFTFPSKTGIACRLCIATTAMAALTLSGCAPQVRIAAPATSDAVQLWSAPRGQAWLLADSVFALRQNPAKLREAEQLYAEAVIRQPEAPELLTLWSRACYLAALHGGLEPDASRDNYKRGIDAGKRALSLHAGYARVLAESSDEVEAAGVVDGPFLEAGFWLAANEGRLLLGSDPYIRRGRAEGIAALVRRMLAVSDTLMAGGPHRLAAAMALRLPQGNRDVAKTHFVEAQRIGPDYFANQTVYAEFYATAIGDRDLYVRVLENVIEQEPDSISPFAAENQLERLRARRLLRDTESLFSIQSTRAEP